MPAAPSPAAPVSIRAATADNVVAPPVLRPNAAAGAKEAAVKMYPALGVKDSTFNKTFRDLYVEKSQKDPEFLTRADWPLLLARQTADLLTVQPTAPAAPVAPPAITVASAGDGHTFKPTLAPNPLERGAYNRGYSHYWWNWNGRYYTYDPPNTPQPAPVTVASGGSGQAANPTPAPSALERGAYNQTRSHYYWWPWTRYYTP
ncbi:MAG: hypothetical protein ABJF10_05305 [Chthoniobacter sp.]|uniref:hypothetical protein n=1 Tax=Chthoniobacter sp. TaxID=2510640 RepID=UPI0032A5E6C6